MITINAVIEKGSKNYGVYSDDNIGNCGLLGIGKTVKEAKEDFLSSIEEAKEATGVTTEVEVSWRYDEPSFFEN